MKNRLKDENYKEKKKTRRKKKIRRGRKKKDNIEIINVLYSNIQGVTNKK